MQTFQPPHVGGRRVAGEAGDSELKTLDAAGRVLAHRRGDHLAMRSRQLAAAPTMPGCVTVLLVDPPQPTASRGTKSGRGFSIGAVPPHGRARAAPSPARAAPEAARVPARARRCAAAAPPRRRASSAFAAAGAPRGAMPAPPRPQRAPARARPETASAEVQAPRTPRQRTAARRSCSGFPASAP